MLHIDIHVAIIASKRDAYSGSMLHIANTSLYSIDERAECHLSSSSSACHDSMFRDMIVKFNVCVCVCLSIYVRGFFIGETRSRFRHKDHRQKHTLCVCEPNRIIDFWSKKLAQKFTNIHIKPPDQTQAQRI